MSHPLGALVMGLFFCGAFVWGVVWGLLVLTGFLPRPRGKP